MRSTLQICVVAVAAFTACRPAYGPPASRFNVADSRYGAQLLRGFYEVETRPNRWAAREFSVALRPPQGSERKGARLWLRFFVPGYQIEQIGAMTLHADVDGYQLQPQTFSEGGFHDFSRAVPPGIFDTSMVPVRFAFDKAVEPSPAGGRELGAVVSDVGLLPE